MPGSDYPLGHSRGGGGGGGGQVRSRFTYRNSTLRREWPAERRLDPRDRPRLEEGSHRCNIVDLPPVDRSRSVVAGRQATGRSTRLLPTQRTAQDRIIRGAQRKGNADHTFHTVRRPPRLGTSNLIVFDTMTYWPTEPAHPALPFCFTVVPPVASPPIDPLQGRRQSRLGCDLIPRRQAIMFTYQVGSHSRGQTPSRREISSTSRSRSQSVDNHGVRSTHPRSPRT